MNKFFLFLSLFLILCSFSVLSFDEATGTAASIGTDIIEELRPEIEIKTTLNEKTIFIGETLPNGKTYFPDGKAIVRDANYEIVQAKNTINNNEKVSLYVNDKKSKNNLYVCFDFKGEGNNVVVTGLQKEITSNKDYKCYSYNTNKKESVLEYSLKHKQTDFDDIKYDILMFPKKGSIEKSYEAAVEKAELIILDPILTDGLVFHMTFDDDTTDSSGYMSDGGVASYDLITNSTHIVDQWGSSHGLRNNGQSEYVFDGVDDSITLGNNFKNYNTFNVKFSVNNYSNSPTILFKHEYTGLTVQSDGKPYCWFYNGSNNLVLGGTSVFNEETIYDVSCKHDETNITIYVNGINENTQQYTGIITDNNNNLYAGYLYLHLNGSIYNISVWDRVLSNEDILEVYEKNKPEIRGDYINTNGLVASYDFALNQNSDDISKNGNNGVDTDVDYIGTGVILNGNNKYIYLTDDDTLELQQGFSWGAKFNRKGTGGVAENLLRKSEGYILRLNSTQFVQCFVYLDSAYTAISSTNAIQNNTNYYAQCDYNETNLNLYINGILNNSIAANGIVTNSIRNVGIGYAGSSNTEFFNGTISKVMIYNRTLSNKEIRSLHEEGTLSNDKKGDELSEYAVVSYDFALNQNSNDDTGNGNDGTDINVDYSGSGVVFDGTTNKYINIGNKSDLHLLDTNFTANIQLKTAITAADEYDFISKNNEYIFRVYNGAILFFYYGGGYQARQLTNVGEDFTEDTFLSIVYNSISKKFTVYKNGVDITIEHASFSTYSKSVNDVFIGKWETNYFNGTISNIGIVNKTLTPEEILIMNDSRSVINNKKAIEFIGGEGFSDGLLIEPALKNEASKFSFSSWFKVKNFTNYNTLIDTRADEGVLVDVRNSSTISIYNRDTDREVVNILLHDSFLPNIWYHVVWTFDAGNITGYLNGVEKVNELSTISQELSVLNDTYWYIGAPNREVGIASLDTINGSMDDVRIYNRVLDSDEVYQLYNSTPSMDYVYINPNTSVYTNTDLEANVSGSDTYEYQWYINNIESVTTSTLSSALIQKNDEIILSSRAYNGESYSDWMNSSVLTILNSIPILNYVNISPILLYNNSTLQGITNSSDLDGDNLIYYWKWFNNSDQFNSSNTASVEESLEINPSNISAENTSIDDIFIFSVQAFDGTSYSSWQNSTAKIVIPITPNINSVFIQPNQTVNFDENITGTCNTNSSANVTYDWKWYKNDVLYEEKELDFNIVPSLTDNLTASNWPGVTLYTEDSVLYMITTGWNNNSYKGYEWNGTNWNINNTIVLGLSNSTVSRFSVGVSAPDVFFINETKHMLYPNHYFYPDELLGISWSNNEWVINNSLTNGIDISEYDEWATPEFFTYNNSVYALFGKNHGTVDGYKWNGTGWEENNIGDGFGDYGINTRRLITTYEEKNNLYALTMSTYSEYLGDSTWGHTVHGWKWNGTQFNSESDLDFTIFLPNSDYSTSAIDSIVYNNSITVIRGQQDYESEIHEYIGHIKENNIEYYPNINNNLTILDSVETSVSDRWVFSCIANDSYSTSEWVNSSELTIMNTGILNGNIVIENNNKYKNTEEIINVSFDYAPGGDLRYDLKYYVNDVYNNFYRTPVQQYTSVLHQAGLFSSPEVFNYKGVFNVIVGFSGNFLAKTYFDGEWVLNTSLSDNISTSAEAKVSAFEYDNNLHIITGYNDEVLKGFSFIDGEWNENSTIINNLTLGRTHAAHDIFEYNDIIYLMLVGEDDVLLFNFSGGVWKEDSNSFLVNGLNESWNTYDYMSFYYDNDILKMSLGKTNSIVFLYWNGVEWKKDNIPNIQTTEYFLQPASYIDSNNALNLFHGTSLGHIRNYKENINYYEEGELVNAFNVSLDNFITKGDNITYSIRAFDGIDYSDWVNSSTYTIQNSNPIINNISINDEEDNQYIYSNGSVELYIDNFDADNDAMQNIIRVYNASNILIDTIYSNDTIVNYNSSLEKNEIYFFNVSVYDGENYSINYTSINNVTVNNYIYNPNGSLAINGSYVTIVLNEYVDIDNDTMKINESKWYINDVYNESFDNKQKILAQNFTESDTIYVNFSIDDNQNTSEKFFTTQALYFGDSAAPILENFDLSETSGIGAFVIYVDTFDELGEIDIANGYPYVTISHNTNGVKTNLSMALLEDNTYYTAYAPQEQSGTYNFTFYSRDGNGNGIVNNSNNLLFTITQDTVEPSTGGGSSTVIIGGEIDYELSPAEQLVKIAPGRTLLKEFEIKNTGSQDLSFIVKEESNFVHFEDDTINTIFFDIDFESGITSNSKFIRYYVNIPDDTPIGEYTEIIYVEAENIKKEFEVQIEVSKSFFTLFSNFLGKSLYEKSYCAVDFDISTNQTTTDECKNEQTLDITNGFLLLILAVFISVGVIFYRKQSKTNKKVKKHG